MTVAVPPAAFAVPTTRWRAHLVGLALTAAALLALFARDVADMATIWWTSSSFGHCLLVGPIIGWLVWERRGQLAQLDPVAWWPGLAVVGAGGAAWWVGEAASVAFARQFGLLLMLVGAVVTLLGPRVAYGLAFPIGYAVFLVPFGEWLEVPLQQVTVALIMPLLALVGIPASADGVMIHAGRYWFEVAEACSGAKFVIAMAAFGVLVAQLCFRSWRRRAAFLVACLIVPIFANGVRAFATIWVADRIGIEVAGGFDHVVFGSLFFGLVIAAMLAAAWRWFDRPAGDAAFDPEQLRGAVAHRLSLVPAALLVLGIAAVFPAWSAAVERTPAVQPRLALPEVPGWHAIDASRTAPWRPWYPGAVIVTRRYADWAGHVVDVAVAGYARQQEGRELVGYGLGVLRGEDAWLRVGDDAPIAGGEVVRIAAGPAARTVASWYRVGDTVTGDPRRVKLATLRARLLGGSQQALALHLSAEPAPGRDPRRAIEAFLASAGSAPMLIARTVR
jgi:exosortase A